MLQRVQTVYLFLAVLSTLLDAYLIDTPRTLIIAGVLSTLMIINIFLFKKRTLQINFNRIICLALIAWVGLSIYQSGLLSGEKQFSEKDIKLLIPVVSIVFLLIANKYIKRDERLVKSVDRIR